jgi:hypothetical protein
MKGGVAEVAGGLFERLAGSFDVGGYVDVQQMQREIEAGAEVGDEGGVGVRLSATEVVVDMNGGEDDAEGFAGLAVGRVEGEEKGDGVGTAGDGAAEAVAGADVFAGEGKCGRGGHRVNRNALVSCIGVRDTVGGCGGCGDDCAAAAGAERFGRLR